MSIMDMNFSKTLFYLSLIKHSQRLQAENSLKVYFEFYIIEGFAGDMIWLEGTLIYKRKYEAMFYHLVLFKRKYSEPVDWYRRIPNEFRISKRKIYQTKPLTINERI